jgi:hypothetical protein
MTNRTAYPTARAIAEEFTDELDGMPLPYPNRWNGWDCELPEGDTLRVCQPDPEAPGLEVYVLMPDGGLAFEARGVTYLPGVTVALLVALADADHVAL